MEKPLVFKKGKNRLSFNKDYKVGKLKSFKKEYERFYSNYTDLSCEDLYKALGGKAKKSEEV